MYAARATGPRSLGLPISEHPTDEMLAELRRRAFRGGQVAKPSPLSLFSPLAPRLSQQTSGLGALGLDPDVLEFGYVVSTFTAMALGAFVGGYHGSQRSGGKPGPTVGWSVAGALLPIPTAVVAVAQGYGKRRRR